MAVVSILVALLSLALPVVLVVLVVRQATSRRGLPAADGHGVRRFFQYLLLVALTVVVATGLVGLLAEPVRGVAAVDTGGGLARSIAFVVVGGPILGVLVAWTRRLAERDPAELAGLGWAAYLSIVQLVAVAVTAVGVHDLARAALVHGRLDAPSAVSAVVWGVVWAASHTLDVRTLDDRRRRPLLLLGTLAGWLLSVTGLVGLLSAAVVAAVQPGASVVVGVTAPLGGAAAVLVAGGPVWVWFWYGRFARTAVDGWWLAYVLPLGVGASLVMAVTGVSIVLDRTLVRAFGESQGTTAEWLAGGATGASLGVVGALSWWYHRQVMARRGPADRTELVRVLQYLLAGIALLAAAVGVALAVVALLEAVVTSAQVLVGEPVVNLVLAAVTLLLVGGPLWWWFWSRIRRARAADPAAEVASPTRRVYLVLLFGVAGVVAVVVVLVAAFLVLDDLLSGGVGVGTAASLRVPVGMLAASAAVSAYHWAVYRADRRDRPALPPRRGPRQVLLVGPRDDAVLDAVVDAVRGTGARVDAWDTGTATGTGTGTGSGTWQADEVVAALAATTRQQVMVLATPAGLQVIEAGAAAGAPPAPVASAPGAEEHRDEPRGRGEQGEPELGEHAQPGGLEGEQG